MKPQTADAIFFFWLTARRCERLSKKVRKEEIKSDVSLLFFISTETVLPRARKAPLLKLLI